MWVSFKSEVLVAIERFIPRKMTKTKYRLTWIYHSIKRRIRKRARKSVSQSLRTITHVQKTIRDASGKLMALIQIAREKKENCKSFWSFVKSLKKDASGITSLRENGILKTRQTSAIKNFSLHSRVRLKSPPQRHKPIYYHG